MSQEYIWCENCKSIQPLGRDEAVGYEDVTGKFLNPTDLYCKTCKYVNATTYDKKKDE